MTMINDSDNIDHDYETTNNERSRNTCTDCVLRTLEELILILTSLERRDHPRPPAKHEQGASTTSERITRPA